MLKEALQIAKAPTLEKRMKFLAGIELNERIKGYTGTKCIKCKHAAFQAKCEEFEEPDYVIPSERLSAKQKNSKYWLVCSELGKELNLGEISECEIFDALPSRDEVNALPSLARH